MSRAKILGPNSDLDANLGRLIDTLKTANLCAPEQLNILQQAQTQYGSLATAARLPLVAQEYLKPKEAADYISSSTSTLAKRRLYGGGPKFSRIGRAIRYAKADLDTFMAANKVSSTSEETAQ